ncbi:response regulator [Methylocystis sp. MJC1]|uniref:ATP-binding response regulator n=1 Tax=Methylocystis sp. MJC1 TaxID=2654282 RepID=UPI0013EA9853|nr:response regulator [Methylocystis sp. MJC1]KAF2992332.1 Transcriptional activator protein CzcR [Methylocystis sp. MJC1]MBU6527470.1 hybrid sensor histidine kinase/response regulator [Methylocystis sp. MJC1]UZX10416.1 response regulator [Methylocystis sp. MJC1]
MSEQAANKWTFVLDDETRLLFVDDDPILAEFAKVHLATPATIIETASNGAEAWERLHKESFDIVLLDVEMPVLDGFGLLEKLRAEPRFAGLPVMMLTGRDDIASIDRAFQLGVNFFAAKPINWRQLSYSVRHVLRTAQMETALRRERKRSDELLKLTNSLLSLISLEAGTPLNDIIGFSDCIRQQIDGPVGESYLKYAAQIDAAARQLQDDFMDLVQSAELSAGSSRLSEDEYPASKILDAVVADISPEWLRLVLVDIHKPTETFDVRCDLMRLARAIGHLAEDVMRGAGHVDLAMSRTPDGGALVTIVATDASQTPPAVCLESRQGMGMAFARCVIELHGGALRSEKRAEGATLIEIFLPSPSARAGNPSFAGTEAA